MLPSTLTLLPLQVMSRRSPPNEGSALMCSGEGEDDDIPDLDSTLKDITSFYRIDLIGKILGEVIPIKFISMKCSFE